MNNTGGIVSLPYGQGKLVAQCAPDTGIRGGVLREAAMAPRAGSTARPGIRPRGPRTHLSEPSHRPGVKAISRVGSDLQETKPQQDMLSTRDRAFAHRGTQTVHRVVLLLRTIAILERSGCRRAGAALRLEVKHPGRQP